MKNLLSLLMCGLLLFGCSDKYDDSALRNDLNDLENRVAKLEELCKQMNTNISSLQTIVTALQNNDYVTGITPVMQGGKEVGYTITFSKNNPITIYHGKDGQSGADGANGKDGTTPTIGVKQDSDGVYYWTLDGNWLTDEHGDKIKAEGKDGADGSDGEDGSDGTDGTNGITPQFKIENDYWFISYDNGITWSQLGKATGEDGKDGEDDVSGDSMFSGVDYKTSADYVIFTLADGTQIKLPTWSAFEALQRLCNETNTNLSALQALVTALQNNDWITGVDPLTENGKVVGYTIKFAKSNPIVIYNGKDGADGVDGNTPVIGVKKDSDDIYYWTLNGEFIVVDGQKIKAQGADGNNGTDGSDGITPKLEIREGYWWISYDNGTNWTQLGKATGDNGADGKDADSIKITQDENNVYFELADGTVITISKTGQSMSDIIHFVDSNVKKICVANWDTNKDGELSYEEAAAITTIGSSFSQNTDITIFTELKYFTKISMIDYGAFRNCKKLWQITLPANIKTIGSLAFCGSAIESIIIPNKVQSIGSEAFAYCPSLSSVTFAKNSVLSEISGMAPYKGAFTDCTQLTDIQLPASLTSLSGGVFYGCNNLQKVSFEKGSQLTSIEPVTDQYNNYYLPFGDCSSLKEFDASNCSKLTSIGQYALVSEVLRTPNIITGDNVNPLKLQIIKMGTATPPACNDNAFTTLSTYNAELIVPIGCSTAYKTKLGWRKFNTITEAE